MKPRGAGEQAMVSYTGPRGGAPRKPTGRMLYSVRHGIRGSLGGANAGKHQGAEKLHRPLYLTYKGGNLRYRTGMSFRNKWKPEKLR